MVSETEMRTTGPFLTAQLPTGTKMHAVRESERDKPLLDRRTLCGEVPSYISSNTWTIELQSACRKCAKVAEAEKPKEKPKRRPLPEDDWRPNWYVTRLHAVTGDGTRALCGTDTTYPEEHLIDWRRERIEAGVPKCKTCLRIADARGFDV